MLQCLHNEYIMQKWLQASVIFFFFFEKEFRLSTGIKHISEKAIYLFFLTYIKNALRFE